MKTQAMKRLEKIEAAVNGNNDGPVISITIGPKPPEADMPEYDLISQQRGNVITKRYVRKENT